MTYPKFNEHMDRAMRAEAMTVPDELRRYVTGLFAGIPQPMRLDDEQIPGRDDLESE